MDAHLYPDNDSVCCTSHSSWSFCSAEKIGKKVLGKALVLFYNSIIPFSHNYTKMEAFPGLPPCL